MPLPELPPAIKKNLPLIIAGVSALAAVFLINLYIRQQGEAEKKRLQELERNMVTVILAATDIPRGMRITEDMVTEKRIHKDKLKPYAATAYGKVIDKIAAVPIMAGDQILLNQLAVVERREQWEGLAAKIPPGKRAVTIPVDNITSVGGMVRPGDYVDLVALVGIPVDGQKVSSSTTITTLPLFQGVLILAINQELTQVPAGGGVTSESAKGYGTATLALSPQEANIIAFIQEQGKIRLVLRPPSDKQALPGVPTDWETVLKTVFPQAGETRPKRTIEIYHGLRKEIKTLD